MHLDNQENKDERDRLQEKVRDLEHKASSEQHKSFAAAIEEQYDKSEMDNVDITKERDSLQDQVVELERQSKAASRLDERVHMNDPELESEVDEDPKHPSQHEALKRSVLISATGQNHACRQMRDQRIGILTLNPRSSKSRKGEAKQQSRRH